MTSSAATPPEATPVVALDDREYHAIADQTLARIERQADLWLQQGVVDIDPQRTGGLLELALPDDSKVVVNKQAPLQEIWLAARRGGFHFKWHGHAWLDTRDHVEFFERLSEQLSAQAGIALTVAADGASPDSAASH
jgi:CyaY protein